jgi:fimbrial chaperone protein
MKLHRSPFVAVHAWLLALVLGSSAAQAFQVRPVRVDLGSRQPAAQLVVSNPTAQTMLIQADAFEWLQARDKESLNPTEHLIVNPPIFELAPGAQQVVRVGLRRAVEAAVELPYRIWLTQVATPGEANDTGVQMLLRVSLPVFVTGAATGTAQAVWQRGASDGAVELGNSGARHLHVRELRLVAEGAAPQSLGPCYALPGGQCRWPVPAAMRDKPLRIEADSNAGTLRTQVEALAPR